MNIRLVGIDGVPGFGYLQKRTFATEANSVEVYFDDSRAEPFIASLEVGALPVSFYSSHQSFAGGTTHFIVLGGRGHLIDTATMRLKLSTNSKSLYSAFYWKHRDLILCEDSQRIFVYSSEGVVWESMRIALDGVAWITASRENVSARVNQDNGEFAAAISANPWSLTVEAPGVYPYVLL